MASRESDAGSILDVTFKIESELQPTFNTQKKETVPVELTETIETWALQNRQVLSDLLKKDPNGDGMVEMLKGSSKSMEMGTATFASFPLTKNSDTEYAGASLIVKKN